MSTISANSNLLLVLVVVVIGLTVYFTLYTNSYSNQVPKSEIDTAINQANYFYSLSKARGQDLSNGPCLSDALLPGWALDIVHNPRSPLDDFPENQCPSYRAGKTKHVVELDIDGKLVRAY